MTNFFPAGIIFWLVTWFLKDSTNEEPKESTEYPNDDIGPIWKIQYYSNGRLLPSRHLFYYCDLINLSGEKEITDETIEDAATKRHSLINKIDYNENWPIASRDVNAAKAYLLDRWNYLSNLN